MEKFKYITHGVRKLHYLQFGLVSQVVYFRPKQRDTTADLHETQSYVAYTSLEFVAVNNKNLFRLIEVSNVSQWIYASTEISSPRPVP